MDTHALTRQLFVKNDSKIVMYVADGLGGLPQSPGGLTELEAAHPEYDSDDSPTKRVGGQAIDAFLSRTHCGGWRSLMRLIPGSQAMKCEVSQYTLHSRLNIGSK